MKLRWMWALATAICLCGALKGGAAIFPQDHGAWPADWPAELEPLRESSRTIGVGTGIQENIYEIPIADRATLDRVWPAVLKLHTHGGRLLLTKAGEASHPNWGEILNNKTATIRIYAPSGGYSSMEEIAPGTSVDYDALIKEGKALQGDAPWPKELIGANGELPEYVVAKRDDAGKMTWVAGDPYAVGDQRFPGFFNRARVDIELVVDGEIIDLNELQLPSESVLRDLRFPAAGE